MSRSKELTVTENLYDKSNSATNLVEELKASAMNKWSEEQRMYCNHMSSFYTEYILLPHVSQLLKDQTVFILSLLFVFNMECTEI